MEARRGESHRFERKKWGRKNPGPVLLHALANLFVVVVPMAVVILGGESHSAENFSGASGAKGLESPPVMMPVAIAVAIVVAIIIPQRQRSGGKLVGDSDQLVGIRAIVSIGADG
jgi:hypothetical protein